MTTRQHVRWVAGVLAVAWLLLTPPPASAKQASEAWIPASKAPGYVSPTAGGVRVRARGTDLAITGYVPKVRRGVAGFSLLTATRAQGAADMPLDRKAPGARDALAQVIDILPQAYVRAVAPARAVRLAMNGLMMGRATDRSGLYRQGAAGLLSGLDDRFTYLAGPPATPSRAQGARPTATGPSAPATRAPAVIQSRLRQGGIGVIRLKTFRADAAAAVAAEIATLTERNGSDLRGLVLDLRGNGGGVTTAAVALADQFLPGGSFIMGTTGREGRTIQQFEATGQGQHPTLPLAILTDRGTASSSEIVTRALQASGRARVFGERTYGKGIGQVGVPLVDGSTLHVTVTRHRDASGVSWHRTGIKPDVSRRTILREARGTRVVDPVLERALADLR